MISFSLGLWLQTKVANPVPVRTYKACGKRTRDRGRKRWKAGAKGLCGDERAALRTRAAGRAISLVTFAVAGVGGLRRRPEQAPPRRRGLSG